MDRTTRRRAAAVGALVAVAAAAAVLLSPSRVLERVAALERRPLLFLGALAALYAVRPLFAWPISPISALVGYVLGMEWGVPVALVGATLTCLPPYLIARRTGEGGLVGRLSHAGRRVVSVTGATRGVLAARLSPLPADPVSYGAGASGVPTGAYVAGTLVGEIPWVIVEVAAGASLRRLALSGVELNLELLAASGLVAALLLAGPAYRHLRDRRGPEETAR